MLYRMISLFFLNKAKINITKKSKNTKLKYGRNPKLRSNKYAINLPVIPCKSVKPACAVMFILPTRNRL